jgi:hypothetical protein
MGGDSRLEQNAAEVSNMRKILRQVPERYRPLIYLAVLALAIVYVPLIPYSPYCWGKESVGALVLAPAFRAKLTARLRSFEVPYIRVDGLVLVRFWDWLADPDDWLINASNKSLYSLVKPMYGADVAQLPQHVRDLIAESEREHGNLTPTCELVRAVAIEGW